MLSIPLEKSELLRKLYFENGWSASDIASELNVGIHAVYNFMRRQKWNRRDHSESNKMVFIKKPSTFTVPVQLSKTQERLKMVAVALYWSEGAKRGNIVDFANRDVEMCKIFIKFLREVCHVNEKKLRGFIYSHYGKNPEELIKFWSRTLKISPNQFTRPYMRIGIGQSENKYPDRMPNGLIHIRYGDLKLLNQIKKWIDELVILHNE